MDSNYATISAFGSSAGLAPENDPLTYIATSGLQSGFLHTLGGGSSFLGPNSSTVQKAAAQICGSEWNGVCEYLSNDSSRIYPNTVSSCNGPDGSCMGSGLGNSLTAGQILIRNSASERFLKAMSDNCVKVYQPFDPTVANSPMISSWVPSGNNCKGSGNCYGSNVCVPVYDVDPKSIDKDVVMNKVLQQPWIALDILLNIYNTRKRTGRLKELENTKIGTYFKSKDFLQLVGGGLYRM
jgi:hypothetical protein